MQPAYYEDFNEIKKKIWLMLDDAVTNRGSQFRIPLLFVVINLILMEELLFLENQIRKII